MCDSGGGGGGEEVSYKTQWTTPGASRRGSTLRHPPFSAVQSSIYVVDGGSDGTFNPEQGIARKKHKPYQCTV